MSERLPGGNTGGASLVDGTVRRNAGPWTQTVHCLLRHLELSDFQRAPRPLGYDGAGREILSYLPGDTVGDRRPWPSWTHSDGAIKEIGTWLRDYHGVVASFVPPPDACWRLDRHEWRPGDIIGHNDAAPYNAVWDLGSDSLVGIIDWDFAAPCEPIYDLAFVASAWVPLHSRRTAVEEGFTDFEDRGRRLRLLLDAYGFESTIQVLFDAVRERLVDHIDGVRVLAASGDPHFVKLVELGTIEAIEDSLTELSEDASSIFGA
jgi:hypothetical protein